MNSFSDMNSAQAYELNGQAVDAAQFTATACDPHRSVVVEACAGSGKTWLLVARMLRLLLDGAEPAELLAITFTRKAAQEMRHRLMELLAELALANDTDASTILRERGVSEQALSSCLPRARKLYENLLNNPQGLSMDTFHSWFGRLLQLAPLASGVPHGFTLVEATGSLQREAWGQLMQQIGVHIVPEVVGAAVEIDEVSEDVDGDAAPAKIKQQLLYLYEALGDFTAKVMLDAFIDKRAEWWAVTQDRSAQVPLQQLLDLMGDDAQYDARLRVWQDHALLERIQQVGICLGKGSPENQKRGVAIETALTTVRETLAKGGDVTLDHFAVLANEFYGADGTNRKNRKTKALSLAIADWLGADNEDAFHDECNAIAETLKVLEKRSKEASVLRLNEALFTVGQAYLSCYQSLKAEQRALDFADLEWQAYRLLSHEDFAAYLHGRLDARYKHILLDEFQDTNPLQWSIISAWLDAYGADTTRPTVFIVGDPKQSIYRFRRADPRVFVAARELLAAQGAAILRTNQTRRNAPVIVEVLNQAMAGNPIYSAQTTAASMAGTVLRLPLIRGLVVETEEAGSTSPFPLRDPLTTPAEEEDDVRRYQEGQQLAQALLQLRAESKRQNEVDLRWSDVMLLVRRRSNLASYEKALREAGIPFVSNRRGGLLSTLEIADLIALLTFLMTPGDNRALAHVLKSPMFSASDEDLITLAQCSETSWWKRLLSLIGEQGNTSPALLRAGSLLQTWMQAAHDLPVHDLLDSILHQGDLVQRYAQAAPATNRAQIIGNITAFTELALNMDGGRYPSLPKFIAALREFDKGAENDAPDESNIGSGVDAVRILTIHSAKGLEAKVVAMLDSNHSDAAKDHIGILCAWPLHEGGEKHFSAFGKKDERGVARDSLFKAEDEQAEQENWNLLYVAVTRAKQVLIVSGIASDKAADRVSEHPGVQQGSWYQRFNHLEEAEVIAQSSGTSSEAQEIFSLQVFTPPDLRLPSAVQLVTQTAEQIEGIALHALMERLTESVNKIWPVKVPAAEVISSWLPCALSVAKVVREQALAIFKNPHLQKFFDPRQFDFARNEMDIVFQQQILRLDRLVVLPDAVWILDYKRQLAGQQEAAYQAQLATYQEALQAIYPMKTIKAALILGDGSLVELAEEGFVA